MAELIMQSMTETAELELLGARARLTRVLHELELYRGRRDHDDYEYGWLLIEYDEASKNLMRCREARDSYE